MEHSSTFTRDWRIKIGTLAMALAIVSAAVAVRPARADEREHRERPRRAHEEQHYRRGHHRGDIYYAPAPDVYYAPPPVIYAPPPPPGGFSFIFPFRIR
jgi:hypothetical protein